MRFLDALKALDRSCRSREEGMGLLWGDPGQGKSTSVAFAANKHTAIYVRARVTWSVTTMLASLCSELGLEPHQRRNTMLDAIAEGLSARPRPIFVDEADYLFRQTDMLDALRDLYDVASVPVVLIGMEDMPKRVRSDRAKFSRFERRITQWIQFNGLTFDDARRVATELCEVEVDDDLVARVHEANAGNIGRMVRGFALIETFASSNGLTKVTLGDYGNRDVRGGGAA